MLLTNAPAAEMPSAKLTATVPVPSPVGSVAPAVGMPGGLATATPGAFVAVDVAVALGSSSAVAGVIGGLYSLTL